MGTEAHHEILSFQDFSQKMHWRTEGHQKWRKNHML